MVDARREAVRTTRTFAAIRILRRSSSFTLCMSRSTPLDGLATNSMAPSSRARSVLDAPSRDSELTMTMGLGFVVMISAVACKPSTCGMLMSMEITSGFSDSAIATASRPSLALPTTCICASLLKMFSSTLRMKEESSTTSTRIFLEGVAIVLLRHWSDRAVRLRSHELFDCGDQLIFLHRLRQEGGSAFLHRAAAVLGAGARRDDHYWNATSGRALAQLHHQLVAGHARHFEVGDDQVAAVLRDQFGSFEAIGSELHTVAILFQHAPYEFAYADRVVGNDDDAFVLDAVDGFRRNGSACDGGGPWRKYARSAGTGL